MKACLLSGFHHELPDSHGEAMSVLSGLRTCPRRIVAVCLVMVAFLTFFAHAAAEDLGDAGTEQVLKVVEAGAASGGVTVPQSETPTCPPGARLVRHDGTPKCARNSDLKRIPASASGRTRSTQPPASDLWICFVIYRGGVPVYDYFSGFRIVFCINLADLFEPCPKCSDGKQCQISDGEAECVYQCGADETGGGEEPCRSCGEGEVPSGDGTACVECEYGESSTGGTCNPDPCEGVNCPDNAHCSGGECQCNAGHDATQVPTGYPGGFETRLVCIPDPCHNKECGANSSCLNGECQCDPGYEDPDGDGNCAKVCTEAAYDTAVKESLLTIPREPWEQGEWYGCNNGTAMVGRPRRTTASKYLYTDFPTNSMENPDKGNVCTLSLPIGLGGGGHSHPHFDWPRDDGVQCGSDPEDTLDSRGDVRATNSGNAHFQSGDKSEARRTGRQLYLVVPERNCVKVYRKNENGSWRQSRCL